MSDVPGARTAERPPSVATAQRLGWMWAALLPLAGVLWAARWRWLCDDAFISFRYAQRLVQGHGLMFNVGPGAEAVEGYTNFLWTVWLAVGMAVGVPPETWSVVWGLAAYGGLLLVLARGAALPWLPLAAALAVVSRPLQIWATGGLETALDLALLLAGWQLLVRPGALTPRRLYGAGVALALATMTRPDSLLIAALSGGCLLLRPPAPGEAAASGTPGFAASLPPRLRVGLGRGLRYGGAFALLWLPFTAWRIWTYGDFFPNTYYAKSAALWWPEQGWAYLQLFVRELPLFAAAPLAGLAALGAGWVPAERRPRLVSALLIQLAFTAYVVKVGGGFMHTRLLLPALPFAWVALEESLAAVSGRLGSRATSPQTNRRVVATVAATLLLLTALTPPALGATEQVRGIVDERAHYDPARAARLERDAQVLRRYLADLPVRAAYIGGQARLVYRTGVPVAVEAETGLTDRVIAHQRLPKRGRVGHEKHAPVRYLVDDRRLHLVFGAFAFRYLGLDQAVPRVGVRLGHATVFLVTWDSALMAKLRERGATVPPFEREARRLRADPTLIPAPQRAATLRKLHRFWPEATQP